LQLQNSAVLKDTENQGQHRCNDARLNKSETARSERLLVMPR